MTARWHQNSTGRVLAGVLGLVVATLTTLTLLGVLPWATRAEVKELKTDVTSALGRIEQKVNDIERWLRPDPPRPDR